MSDGRKVSGGRIIVRKKQDRALHDTYYTPTCAIRALMDRETFKGSICEPACGKGHISEYLRSMHHTVTAMDIRPTKELGPNCIGLKDFLSLPFGTWQWSNIITNPPYSLAEEFIRQAHEHASQKIAMLLRLSFAEGQGRYNLFKQFPPSRILVFSKRLPYIEDGEWNESGGQFTHAWFVWNKSSTSSYGKRTTFAWIPAEEVRLYEEDYK